MKKSTSTLTALGMLSLAASPLSLGCAPEDSDFVSRPGDGAYRYVLGYDPVTGEQITGGTHKVVEFDLRGKAEAIDWENRAQALHPELGKLDYQTYDASLEGGKTSWDVFPSQWWPMSKNGTAWRWQPGANQDYEDLSDKDTLSPLEKYDLMFNPGQPVTVAEVEHCEYSDFAENGDDCNKITHPEVTVAGPATAWEFKNQGVYQTYEPEGWWGHCNGWASYATAEPDGYPKRDVRVKLDDAGKIVECQEGDTDEGCILYKMADIEALMTELYFSDQATFTGRRCNTRPDEIERDEFGRPTDPACRDLNAGSLHIAMAGLLGKGAKNMVTQETTDSRPAFIIDHTYDYQVWNFPLVEYQIVSQTEVDKSEAARLVGVEDGDGGYQFNEQAVKFVRVQANYWMISDGVGVYELLKPADQRNIARTKTELNYVLELDAQDKILGGEWIKNPELEWGEDSKKLHPDFAWMAVSPKGWGEDDDDLGGDSDNPHIAYSKVKAILACANDPSTCNADGGGGVDPEPEQGGACEGACGGSSTTENGDTCYCDAVCAQYGDCCPGYEATCEGGSEDPEDPEGPADPEPTVTCEGSCGSTSPAPGSEPACYCDSACVGYGDCCEDAVEVCGL